MNEITKTKESRHALQWLARELAWERVLSGLRSEDPNKALALAALISRAA
ncbi:MAG TPA: hypothetical protein VFS70_12205 [Actinomycetota bacterium]|nr:hypothetical protein [Actinomycetota bacterium]